jgi:hypothetical protein
VEKDGFEALSLIIPLHFFDPGYSVCVSGGVLWGEKEMSLNKKYASFLMAASNIYAGQSSTTCSKAESQFERSLFKLFSQASNGGMALQDIVVITSTAIAVMLTDDESIHSAKRQVALDGNVIALRSRASQ